jgi:environmental stress-induced protein Ves
MAGAAAILTPIPLAAQREEPWANGAGITRVVLRRPDSDAWRVRVSVARVAAEGPFSELSDTRRVLVPLDAPMVLRFADGDARAVPRLHPVRFAGAPAPTGQLPAGPTRDFNLMLRDGARGEVFARRRSGATVLPATADANWLVYLDSGRVTAHAGTAPACTLTAGDAVRVVMAAEPPRITLEGSGQILLVKLYA